MIDAFIQRWKNSGGHERANYALFLTELCDLLKVDRPDPAMPENESNAYVFERSVKRANADGTSTTKYIDFYRAGCFILETKQGVVADPGIELNRIVHEKRDADHAVSSEKLNLFN